MLNVVILKNHIKITLYGMNYTCLVSHVKLSKNVTYVSTVLYLIMV